MFLFLIICVALAVLPRFVSETTWARGLGDKVLFGLAIVILILIRISR